MRSNIALATIVLLSISTSALAQTVIYPRSTTPTINFGPTYTYGVQQPVPQTQPQTTTPATNVYNPVGSTTASGQPNVSLPSNGQKVDDVLTPGKASSQTSNRTLPGTQAPTASTATTTERSVRSVQYAGIAKVIDGSTIQIGTDVLILNGAAAPDLDQVCHDRTGLPWTCGARAKTELEKLALGHFIVCKGVENAINGVAAKCKSGETDLGRSMVAAGFAVAPPAISTDYIADQAIARSAMKGIWSGVFEQPWVVRARNRPDTTTNTSTSNTTTQTR